MNVSAKQVGNIKNQYRVFDMEVLAGEHKLVTEVTQYKARFQLDFSKVWPLFCLCFRL